MKIIKETKIELSLILATYGRVEEVFKFCESLNNQSYDLKKIELIIVDQNEHYEIIDNLQKNNYSYDVKYIRTNEKGLSNARNLGFKNSSGMIIGYPDDDCTYYYDTVEKVLSQFNSVAIKKIVIGRIFDKSSEKNIIKNWPNFNKKVNFLNYYKFSSSIVIFHSRNIGLIFDSEMGAGKHFGSSEDLDFIYRSLELNYEIEYIKDINVWHPEFNSKEVPLNKVRSYTRGFGYFIRKKHNFLLPKLLHLILLIFYKIYQFFGNIRNRKFKNGYFYSYLIGFIEGIVNK